MTKCKVIQDLYPLYAEDLISAETKGEIDHHLSSCTSCAQFFHNMNPLTSIEIPISNNDESIKQTFIKLKLIQEQYFVILIGLGIAVYHFLFSLNGFDSIPWMILIPFLLTWLYDDIKKMVFTTILMTLVFAALGEDIWYGIWMLPFILLCSGSGIVVTQYLKKGIKHWSLKRILSFGLCLIALCCSFTFYNGLKGNPLDYFKAHKEINHYLNQYYEGKVTLKNIDYTPKINAYIETVVDSNDSKYDATLMYNDQGISDLIQVQIKQTMANQVQTMLELLIVNQTDLTRDDFIIDIVIPDFIFNSNAPSTISSYRLSDDYDETLPVFITIHLNPLYPSKDGFASMSSKLMDIIESSGIKYYSINFESFFESGNASYLLITKKPFNSLDEAIELVTIREYDK